MAFTRLKLDDIKFDRMVLANADDTRDALEAEYEFIEKRRQAMLSKAGAIEQRMSQLQAELRNIDFHQQRFVRSVDEGCTWLNTSYRPGDYLSYTRRCRTH